MGGRPYITTRSIWDKYPTSLQFFSLSILKQFTRQGQSAYSWIRWKQLDKIQNEWTFMLAKVAGKVIKFVLEQQLDTKSYQLAWELSNLRRGPTEDGSVFSLIHILQFTGARVIYWSRQHFTGLADLLRVSPSGFNIQARYLNTTKTTSF